jgi:hypothetical protein
VMGRGITRPPTEHHHGHAQPRSEALSEGDDIVNAAVLILFEQVGVDDDGVSDDREVPCIEVEGG